VPTIDIVHVLDRGDIIDMLEESVATRRPVVVELHSDKKFIDHVRDVVTRDGEDWALFRAHEPVPVTDIHSCSRASPLEPTYAGKL
jgi:Rho-binding antiterminator